MWRSLVEEYRAQHTAIVFGQRMSNQCDKGDGVHVSREGVVKGVPGREGPYRQGRHPEAVWKRRAPAVQIRCGLRCHLKLEAISIRDFNVLGARGTSRIMRARSAYATLP